MGSDQSCLQIYWFSDPRYESIAKVTPHIHCCFEFILLAEGSAFYTAGSCSYQLDIGDLCIVKPGEEHTIKGFGEKTWRIFCAGIDNFDIPELYETLIDTKLKCIRGCKDLIPGFIRLLDEAREPRFNSPYISQILMNAWLIEVVRHLKSPMSIMPPNQYSVAVHNARNYIENNASHGLSVREVANQIGYSESHLAHLFSEETHIPLYQYILRTVMQRALRLLEEGELNVSEIADMLGFPSISNFSESFKRHFGISPSHYIRKH